ARQILGKSPKRLSQRRPSGRDKRKKDEKKGQRVKVWPPAAAVRTGPRNGQIRRVILIYRWIGASTGCRVHGSQVFRHRRHPRPRQYGNHAGIGGAPRSGGGPDLSRWRAS